MHFQQSSSFHSTYSALRIVLSRMTTEFAKLVHKLLTLSYVLMTILRVEVFREK